VKPPRWFLPAVLAAWALFTAWLLWGFPPPVDLPAHAAQLETLANLVRGDPQIAKYSEIRFPWGYGLDYWVFLPLAMLTNGAVAARVDLWVTLQLFVLGELALLRAFKRSDFALLLGLPLAFNLSYWYGYVPGLLAQALALCSLACFVRALSTGRARWLVALNACAAATLFSHLLAFAVLGLLLLAVALCHPPRWRSLRALAYGLGASALLSVPKAYSMATRAVSNGAWPPTEYAALSHFNWFFKNYIPEGWLAAWAAIGVALAMVILWWRRRAEEPRTPAVLFASMLAIYLATPKTLSGIYLISVRLPVLAGVLALPLVDWGAVPKALKWVLLGACAFSLGETALFHQRFKREVAGLGAMIPTGRPPKHGYASLVGREILGSKNIYLEHMGQWVTATRGGVGHNFFADAEHHPVRFKPGVEIPFDLKSSTPEQLRWFDEVVTFGEGPLPEGLSDARLVAQQGRWRKWAR